MQLVSKDSADCHIDGMCIKQIRVVSGLRVTTGTVKTHLVKKKEIKI